MSYLELWWPSYSTEQNLLCNFGKGHYGEHSCGIILNLDVWLRRIFRFKIKLTDDERLTHDGRTMTDHKSSH